MVRNLILAGGLYHPLEECGLPLSAILAGVGLESEVTADVEGGLARLASGQFDRLTIACLRWSMTQNEKYAPHRADWALSLSPAGRAAIRDYVASGRGLLAIHTAPICFDDWAEWPALLGIGWRWGVSHHPPLAPLTARPIAAHPITSGMAPFMVTDEIYSALDVQPWMLPLVDARHADMTDGRPVVFAGEDNGCRRVWCGLGHDAQSLSNPEHRALIQRAARWIARDPD